MYSNLVILIVFVVVVIADLLKNLFPESLMDATIQDSGTRVRRDVCNIMLTLNPKFKNKKINRKENRNKKESEINRVYYLQF